MSDIGKLVILLIVELFLISSGIATLMQGHEGYFAQLLGIFGILFGAVFATITLVALFMTTEE